jgi:small subunit ribosomal protein S17
MKKTTTTTEEIVSSPKEMTGIVVSGKMEKTIVVAVERYVKHPKYQKYYTISKKYKVHVEGEKPSVGSQVTVVECRPISKDKHFTLK